MDGDEELLQALAKALRLAEDRARRTAADRDVRLALVLEAARHAWIDGGKKGTAIAQAATRYLRAADRNRPLAPAAGAAEWTDHARLHVDEALALADLARKQVGIAAIADNGTTAPGWKGKKQYVVRVDPSAHYERIATMLVRNVRMTTPLTFPAPDGTVVSRMTTALAEVTEREELLRKLLAAFGLDSATVNRLTKAKYVRTLRATKAKRRPSARSK